MQRLVEKIEREGYTGLQGFVNNKDYKARILLATLQDSEVQFTHDGKLRLPGQVTNSPLNVYSSTVKRLCQTSTPCMSSWPNLAVHDAICCLKLR